VHGAAVFSPAPGILTDAPLNPGLARGARIASVDAYRGLVMLLMLAEVLQSCDVAAALPDSRMWRLVCYEQTHAAWTGCTLHDLIQPSFYFLVGIGLLLSLKRRVASGYGTRALAGHAIGRSLALIFLGITFVSVHPREWTWWFADTLTQIGLAYPLVFVIATRRRVDWWLALAVLLGGYWLFFALYPLPSPSFDYAHVGVPPAWLSEHGLSGFAAHWQKNSNPAAAFDRWLLNLFPRGEVYVGSETGLATLNFIPSVGTMIIGLLAGEVLTTPNEPYARLRWLSGAGLLLVALGWFLAAVGVAPLVKAVWTPSWVLYSGGWCCLILAAWYGLVDVIRLRWAVFPLVVIGLNSLVAYALSHLFHAFAFNSLRQLAGERLFMFFGAAYEPFVYGVVVLLLYWAILYVLYSRRVFVRI
jgi:heparan-alpha-glucosaminide N-acetyltransferase